MLLKIFCRKLIYKWQIIGINYLIFFVFLS
nr:MAG TPA: hypothetical protein [Caudoviricetes sp.]